ncbi:MAG: hypothetical protein JJU11_17125 [Candidatus Sumerlaeia bacterium]|nr:hypothetical protein [Candidatus Sumerlaeia bacterium]
MSRKPEQMKLVVLPGASTNRDLLELAERLVVEAVGWPILLGRREDFLTTAEILGLNLRQARFIFPVDDPVTEDLVVWLAADGFFPGHSPDHLRVLLLADEVLFGAALVGSGRAAHLYLHEDVKWVEYEGGKDAFGLLDRERLLMGTGESPPFEELVEWLQNRAENGGIPPE